MIASNSASSSPNEVSIRQAISGIRDRISRQTETPSPSGSRTSSTATSGRSAGILASADAAVPASPMTVISGSASSMSLTPRRTISWSSSRKTLMPELPCARAAILQSPFARLERPIGTRNGCRPGP